MNQRQEQGPGRTGGGSKGKRRRGSGRSGRGPRPFTPLQLAQRAAALPVVTFPDLPVSAHRDQIAAAIAQHQVVIVAGETGSGKTTQLPKICLQLGRGISGLIGHTQPRRLAARSVAERIADELGQTVGREPGQVIGYQVRFTDEVGPTTLVKLMTDGILLNEIQVDPDLRRYDTLIIDEAHERSLNIDFILGYLARLLPRRPDLKVIITSATIDSDRFADHFSQFTGDRVPVIEVSGRTYPVEIRYRPLSPDQSGTPAKTPTEEAEPSTAQTPGAGAPQLVLEDPDDDLATLGYGLGEAIDLEQGLCGAVDELLSEPAGDILVFLPGERDIREAQVALEEFLRERRPPVSVELVPLFARLSAAEQHRIFAPHSRRRIILSTNIAETSLTVPGIKYVVDAGLARISRFSNKTKVQRLPIERVSQASANQRSGRAGRLEDGIAIRLYSAGDYAARPRYTEPEILRTSLAAVILQMAALGLGEVSQFPFLDPPSSRAVRDGVQLLVELGALTEAGKLTSIGRKLARLPIDPRLGRMLLAGQENGCASEVLVIIAALSIQDVRERPLDAQAAADQAHARFNDSRSDFMTYLNLWRYLNVQARDLSGSAFRRLCHREYLHYLRFREWRDVVGQLRQMCREMGIQVEALGEPDRGEIRQYADPASAVVEYGRGVRAVDYDQLHRALLVGLLSNIGTWEQAKGTYLGARATRFTVWPGSGLAGGHPPWIMAAELVETSRLFARTVAQIKIEWVEHAAQHLLTRSYSEPYWSRAKGAALIKERVSLYGLTLAADRSVLLASLGDRQLGASLAPQLAPPQPGSIAAIAQGLFAQAGSGGWSSQFFGPKPEAEGLTARELAREMFLREALVEGNWRVSYLKFQRENQELLDEAREVEQRSRQAGKVAGEEELFRFFDERVPAEITSARSFENWWKKTRPDQPRLLNYRWEDVIHDVSRGGEDGFPDHWQQGELSLPLSYDFQPGSDTDGVTVTIALAQLPQVQDEGFDWLVPGLLSQLCAGTIRALPKEKRRLLAPAPDVGEQVAKRLTHRGETVLEAAVSPAEEAEDPRSLGASLDRLAQWAQQTGKAKGPLTVSPQSVNPVPEPTPSPEVTPPSEVTRRFFPAFAQAVANLRGVELTEADEQHVSQHLPAHLQMHFQVVDRNGKVLAHGSSLLELQRRLAPQADRAIHQAVRQAVRQAGKERPGRAHASTADAGSWQQEEVTEFPSNPIAPVVETTNAQGLTVRGYPALVAAPDRDLVSLRLCATAEQAELSHRDGVARLLERQLRLPLTRVTTRWSGREALLLAASPYPSTEALVAAAQLAAARTLRAELAPQPIRRAEDFAELVSQARDRFEEEVYRLLQLTVKSLEAQRRVEEALDRHPEESLEPVRRQVRRELKRLLSADFLTETDRRTLSSLPRYLDALAIRLDRAARGPAALRTDQERWSNLLELRTRWDDARERAAARPLNLQVHDRLNRVKWLLEELAVSQFAEQLGTAERVSPQRISRQLDAIWEG